MAETPLRLLVLDTSYSLETLRANQQEASVTCRDLDGFFDEVWTVHPFATLVTSDTWTSRTGRPVCHDLARGHRFIEGKIGRFCLPTFLAPLNFLIAQIGLIRQLRRLITARGISVVRTGDPLLMGLYGWLLARWTGRPLLVRVGGNYERLRRETGRPIMPRMFRSTRVERWIERFVLRAADCVAAVNDDNRSYVIDMGVAPRRATVFRYGNLVDPVHFVAPDRRQCSADLLEPLGLAGKPFVLCVGRLEAVKLPDHAVQVLVGLRRRGLDVSLLLVGAGQMREALERLAESLGIAEHVVFAGARDQQWLASVIPQADVVLSPLTGRALSEVALGAAPTVAYALDWQGELIQDGLTGALVPAFDVDAMTDAASRFIRDRDLARACGRRLRAAALEMMDPARLNAHERTVYLELLGGSQPPSAHSETR